MITKLDQTESGFSCNQLFQQQLFRNRQLSCCCPSASSAPQFFLFISLFNNLFYLVTFRWEWLAAWLWQLLSTNLRGGGWELLVGCDVPDLRAASAGTQTPKAGAKCVNHEGLATWTTAPLHPFLRTPDWDQAQSSRGPDFSLFSVPNYIRLKSLGF